MVMGSRTSVTLAVDRRSAIGRWLAWAGVALSVLLGGCGLVSENASSAFIAPGKYDYYTCEQLSVAGRSVSDRERELTELTERAAQGPGGEFVGAIAYRTELVQARGQLKQIAGVSAQKNCSVQSKWQSDRALW